MAQDAITVTGIEPTDDNTNTGGGTPNGELEG
jgi:hypothetical protein